MIADYETPFRQFREHQGMKGKTFVEVVNFSSNDILTLDGREHLRSAVESQGFKML